MAQILAELGEGQSAEEVAADFDLDVTLVKRLIPEASGAEAGAAGGTEEKRCPRSRFVGHARPRDDRSRGTCIQDTARRRQRQAAVSGEKRTDGPIAAAT